ncbi:heterodisulfide reductase-related iron-sulfur binding cluster [Desulfosporosinus youngiae]|uniref:Fe-S oxidoreductase n=1 Tax=Desulfosporosinus youngiae DSM 17734 TaxID=768710 RepID=H5Y2F7_9FIRM|nr:heterodisulfide reductase-related iron-sulfur binding cluster [Desulfosporosinus youngiae]EHQ88648.1 Fe-S oxidoreductase [Desulfosporosinus youngiae DSM 17734]
MEATRELFWNTGGKGLMYLLALLSMVIFIQGLGKKIRNWSKGRPVSYNDLGPRFIRFLSDLINHDTKIFKGTFRRFMHLGIFYGFVILTLGTLVIAIQEHFGFPLFYGRFYLILSLLMDLFGLWAMIGIGMAAYKRYIDKPDHEDYTFDNAFLLILIFSILFTGYVLEGLRIYATHDPWAWWSPVGLLFSAAAQLSGLSELSALTVHTWLWYFHMLLVFGFIAYIPYSNLFHMIASSLAIFFKSSSPIGGLTPVSRLSKEVSNPGAARLEDFTKKQLLELDACISCKRCQKGCPANICGAPLSPNVIIQDLKRHSQAKTLFLRPKGKDFDPSILDKVISKETLMSCTTCGLCEDKCPIQIEHIKRIVDMRRALRPDDPSYPPELQRVFKNISESGNPWGLSLDSKYYLSGESQAPLLNKNQPTDILYWVGCLGSYETRNQNVSQVMFKLFEKAGVNYAVLGREEKCCGDSVRRLGNETLFQQLALETIRNLNQYQFKTIVTHCPHCYHTLKNDYPQFGGHYQVLHHSEFILALIKSGKLEPKPTKNLRVNYHDPCYLGRYNNIYQAPRDLLTSIPGLQLIEMKNNYSRAFCCGAGGGRIWLENPQEHLIGRRLVAYASKNKPDILASACSLCLKTLAETLSCSDSDIESLDIAEIVYKALQA